MTSRPLSGHRVLVFRWVAAIFVMAVGCTTGSVPPTKTVFGGDRPVTLEVGRRYDHDEPTPLLILLHGFAVAAYLEEEYIGLKAIVDEKNFLYVAPEGLLDADGRFYWNGTDACCDFYDSGVDDVGYIVGLVDEIAAEYNVDEDRVFIVGHSNGGFLAYRIACEQSSRFAAIVSLAGLTYNDPSACRPEAAVSVLQIHGTDDRIIPYDGAQRPEADAPHPSAPQTATMWSQYDGCQATRETIETIDIDTSLRGEETTVERHVGCPPGIDVELWTIANGGHIPSIDINPQGDSFNRRIWRFMDAHPRPSR